MNRPYVLVTASLGGSARLLGDFSADPLDERRCRHRAEVALAVAAEETSGQGCSNYE